MYGNVKDLAGKGKLFMPVTDYVNICIFLHVWTEIQWNSVMKLSKYFVFLNPCFFSFEELTSSSLKLTCVSSMCPLLLTSCFPGTPKLGKEPSGAGPSGLPVPQGSYSTSPHIGRMERGGRWEHRERCGTFRGFHTSVSRGQSYEWCYWGWLANAFMRIHTLTCSDSYIRVISRQVNRRIWPGVCAEIALEMPRLRSACYNRINFSRISHQIVLLPFFTLGSESCLSVVQTDSEGRCTSWQIPWNFKTVWSSASNDGRR